MREQLIAEIVEKLRALPDDLLWMLYRIIMRQ